MIVREPIVAGRFYAAEADRCRIAAENLLSAGKRPSLGVDQIYGGLVPHAGWACSGAVAASVFEAIRSVRSPQTVVLFGGVHRYRGQEAALFASGMWETPLGPLEIDARLAERILGHTSLIVDDAYAHEDEHSLEVQTPFVRLLFPNAKIVPIMVPPRGIADEVGEAVARTISAYNYDAVVVGTTDLTHYGPHYGFVPQGVGEKANRWAKEVNDRRFIDIVCAMRSESVVSEALQYKNACSSGAVAATMAACAKLGATKGVLLQHTASSEVLAEQSSQMMEDSVGYAGIVFV
jgi:AmmeMemoRadiSam system protein B